MIETVRMLGMGVVRTLSWHAEDSELIPCDQARVDRIGHEEMDG